MIKHRKVNLQQYKGRLTTSNIALGLEYRGAICAKSGDWNWCSSVIKGEDGMYHLFSTRWFGAYEDWKMTSEIVQLTSKYPDRDFVEQRVVLSAGIMPSDWQMCAHNGHIYHVDGKYILLYITFDKRIESEKDRLANQMIGMVVLDNLDAEYTTLHKDGIALRRATCEDNWTYNVRSGVTNPTFVSEGGKYKIYFKGVHTLENSGYGVAVSDSLGGEYVIDSARVTDNIGYTEDACNFVYNGERYFMTTDNLGVNTGLYGAGILWREVHGKLALANAEIGYGRLCEYTKMPLFDKGRYKGDSCKLERPFVLVEDGVPTYLYGATHAGNLGIKETATFAFKINI